MAEECRLCRLSSGEEEPPGGWVYRDERWFACVLPGYEVPGWLAVGLRQHAEGLDQLDPSEAGAFGVVVQRVAHAIRQVTPAERLYLVGFGEEYPHVHFMLAARPPQPDGGAKGPAYLSRRDELRDPDAAARAADAIRAIINRSPETS